MPITPTKKIWMDGELVDWENATTHVLSHTLHYGTGAFEGIRAYKTPNGRRRSFDCASTWSGCCDSCKILMIDVPFTLDELCDATVETVRVNELDDGCYIRPLVYLGYGEMGINPLGAPINVAIARVAVGRVPGRPRSRERRADEDLLVDPSRTRTRCRRPRRRSAATSTRASPRSRRVKAGYDEAIMLGTDARLSECTGENLFIVRDGLLISPPPSEAGALRGHHPVEHREDRQRPRLPGEFRGDAPRRPLPRRRGLPHRHRRRGRADRLGGRPRGRRRQARTRSPRRSSRRTSRPCAVRDPQYESWLTRV